MKKLFLFISSLFLFLAFNINVNAQVINYSYMGKDIDGTISLGAGSSTSANTYFTVTSDSTAKYLVVDLCTTLGTSFTSSVTSNYDGSSTSYYKKYDIGSSCSVSGYTGTTVRVFYVIDTFADAGSGYYGINNTMKLTNNTSYYGYLKLISIGLSDSLDLGDLTINNQNTIINNINNINSSIASTEENITNEIDDMEDSINSNINDTFTSCTASGKNLIDFTTMVSGYPTTSGELTNTVGSVGCRRTELIKVSPNTTYTFTIISTSTDFEKWIGVAYYSSNSTSSFIKRVSASANTFTFTTTSETNYIAIGAHNVTGATQVQLELGSSSTSYEEYGETCKNKIDETNDKIDQTNQELSNLNSNLNDSDTSDATNEAGNFFSGFETDTFGLTSIITAPLNLIGSITSSTCSPLGLQVPFVENTTLNLPCMTSIYQNYFGSFLSVYQTITFGIIAYWVCVRIFALVKDFKNPDHDEIEVLDL